MSIHRRISAVLTVGACLALSACTLSGAHLNARSEASSIVCSPPDAQGRLAIAHAQVQSDGSLPVHIRAVTLKESENLRIEAFGVLSDDEDGFRGFLSPSDPEAQISANQEVSAGGQATIQLVVALEDPGKVGTIESLELEYDDLGRTGSQTVTAGLTVQVLPDEAESFVSMCDTPDE